MTEGQVIQVLDSLSNVADPWRPMNSTLAWYWKQPAERKTAANMISLENGQVQHILLSIDFDLTVKQIIDKYGIPDAVNVVKAGLPENPYMHLNLFYPTRGLIFGAKALPFNAPALEPSTKVYEAQYTIPVESLATWQTAYADIGLHPWPGYGHIEVP